MVALTKTKIESYEEKTPTAFLDFLYFGDDDGVRKHQREAFLSDETYFPAYFYPKMDDLSYNRKAIKEKTAIYKAGLELEQAKKQPGLRSAELAELDLYTEFFTRRLQMIMLVEAARNLNDAGGSAEQEVTQGTFMDLNERMFGEFDVSKYRAMMATEYNRISEFVPASEGEQHLKDELLSRLEAIKSNDVVEKPLMDQESLNKLHDVVLKRYKVTLDIIPNTEDSVYYNAEECVKIINEVLVARGLAAKGWKSVIDKDISVPFTFDETLSVSLPTDTKRNARELRRLVIHEVEVHAMRAQNGIETGIKILRKGTANNADIEEGLGVLLECAIEGNWDNPSFQRARDRYITAGLALGSETEEPRNAREVEDILSKILSVRQSEDGSLSDEDIKKARKQAYTHVENAFRGTKFWMKGIIYTKLKVYYEGLEKNAEFFMDNIDNIDGALDLALKARFDHTDGIETSKVFHMVARKYRKMSSRAVRGIVNKQN